MDPIEHARVVGERLADVVADRVGADGPQRDSIRALEALVRHGTRGMDLTVRKDGREYQFEVDWLKYLFRAPQED